MFLLFDIGGTNIRVARSATGENLGEVFVEKTPADWNEATNLISRLFEEAAKGEDVTKIAGGIAGVFDAEKTTLLRSPNLPGWIGKPIKETFEKISRAKAELYNDTAIAGLGEAVLGAGAGRKLVAYLAVGTGVGGVKIEHGRIDETRAGAEPGHQIIDSITLSSLENFISGKSFAKRFGGDFVANAPLESWNEAARHFAVGIHNTILHWSPDIVVLGGGMINKKPGIPIEEIRKNLAEIMKIFPVLPTIEVSKFKDLSGLYGAMSVLNENSV